MLEFRRDVPLLIALVIGFVFSVYAVSWTMGQPIGSVIVGALLLVILASLILFCYRRLLRALWHYSQEGATRQEQGFRQIEAYIQLQLWIQPRLPLPQMRGMVISPDFAVLLIQQIFRNQATRVVELGCGTSSLVSAYCLERIGKGRLVSVDHEAQYAEECRRSLRDHGLQADVLHAPLVPVTIGTREYRYYDPAVLKTVGPIDLLVVDGPPTWIGKLARYPALPLLRSLLTPEAMVLLDDAGREDEQNAVQLWLEEFPEFEKITIDTEKGAILLRRKAL